MGAIKGILLILVCVFLFLSLLIGNLFLTMNMSLTYGNVEPEMKQVLNDVIEEQNLDAVIEDNLALMKIYCQSNSEYVFEHDALGYSLVLPCSVILEGSEAIISYSINNLVDEVYYDDYDCGFIDCLEKTGSPFFLISEKAKNYWNSRFYFSLLISFSLIVFIFLFTEKKSNTLIITGSLLIISSLPFAKLDLFMSFISDKLFLGFFKIFFSESYTVFIFSLIVGIVLLVIGILFKIFNISFKISEFFSKFSKKGKSSKPILEKKSSKIVKSKKNLQIPKVLVSKKKSDKSK